jgi:hypothetical protein
MSASGMPAKPALLEELRDYRDQFENIKEDAVELTAVFNDAQFNWRPSPKRWSISECLAHLNKLDGQDIEPLAQAIERGRAAGMTGQGPFRYGFLSRRIVRMFEPPAKFKFKAPKRYVPPAGEPKEKVVAEFLSIHDQLLSLVHKANGLDLARIIVPSSIPMLKFSLGQRFALLAAHDRRHLWQAWQVRKEREFPL